ncbi:MAG: S8 family serine peptidase [Ruminococcus sp.]|nr:S8 family serine peptidase [Ruminococcus sp.]
MAINMKINSKMIKISGSVLLCLAVLLQSTVVFAADKGGVDETEVKLVGDYVEGEAVVLLNDNADSKYLSKSKACEAYGSGKSIKDTSSLVSKNGKKARFATIKAEGESTEELISELKNNSAVKYACPNTIKRKASITNDAYSDFQWALDNTGQNGGKEGADTNPETLWPAAKSSSKDAIVAVMDTGIDYNHEDLKDILWVNPYGSKLPGIYGYDFSGDIADHSPYDNDGHGSHVAGIIAGQADNGIGISGINKSNVKIMSLKFLDGEGNGTFSGEIDSFEYIKKAYNLGANIKAVNCSYGGISDINEKKMYDEIFDTLGSYGIVACVASGNEFLNLDNIRTRSDPDYQGAGAYSLPAETDSDYALTVAACDERDGVAKFSNIGQCVDIAAPGTSVLSTVSYNSFNPSLYTETQISQLCRYYENYENGTPSGFGKPNVYGTTTSSIETDTANCFTSHKGMVFKSTASGSGKKKLIFEFPYTIDNIYQDYKISFMLRVSGKLGTFSFDDVESSFNSASRYTDILSNGWGWYVDGDDSWCHIEKTIKALWLSSKNRKLVFYVETEDTVAIDDIAIGFQGADEDDYGKYEFYPGTSMATPYVAGAVALIANCRPDFDAYDICSAIKNTGRDSTAFSGKTETGKVLSLDKILDFVPPLKGKTGNCSWLYDYNSETLTLTGSGATANYDYSFDTSTGEQKITTPWAEVASDIKKVVVNKGVTAIGDGCFAGCTSLTDVSLPQTLTSIGKYAFFETNMDSVKLPDNIATIRKCALGYYISYGISSCDEVFNNMFTFYAYTGSKTAATLKANGFTFKSLGGLTLSKSSASLYVKGTAAIKPVLKNISGTTTYSSSNTKVAKVSSAGKVTAVKKGTAKITVKNGYLSQTFKVTVKNPKLNAASKTLKKGKTFKLKITGKVGKAVFKSSNKKIAAVTTSGKIKAKKKGKATITVKTNGLTLKCKVKVK